MRHVIASPIRQARELVINWHVTEVCNYRCRYCFAKWEDRLGERELIHDGAGTSALLHDLFRYFHPDNLANPLRQGMSWKSVRLNLAGGEPLLYRAELAVVVRRARQLGFDVSLISNGSRLDAGLMAELAPHLTLLGLSLDSAQETTSRQIGRADRRSSVVSPIELVETVTFGRGINPRLKLKINTVVNAWNWREDMQALIRGFAPHKWKVLQILPIVTHDLAISGAQYAAFVQRHQAIQDVMCVEDNDSMAESYIMVDPRGRFFQNASARKGYEYSDPILKAGVDVAFSQVGISAQKFCARYPQPDDLI